MPKAKNKQELAAVVERVDDFSTAGPGRTNLLRAWQDGFSALLHGWEQEGARPVARFWGVPPDSWPTSPRIDRIVRVTRELGEAQLGLAVEWLQLPLLLAGGGSPIRTQSSYTRVVKAYNELFLAYVEAAAPVRKAVDDSLEQIAEVVRDASGAEGEVASDAVETVAAVQDAAAHAAVLATEQTVEAAALIVREGSAAVEAAVEGTVQDGEQQVEAPPTEPEEEATEPIKGHVADGGEKIYHLPGQSSYQRTEADERFPSEAEAQAAGFRRALTPGAGRIKGKLTREGEKIYHMPGQANYDRFVADALFESEEQAQAAGFRPSQR